MRRSKEELVEYQNSLDIKIRVGDHPGVPQPSVLLCQGGPVRPGAAAAQSGAGDLRDGGDRAGVGRACEAIIGWWGT